MIGKLTGLLDDAEDNFIILNVGGVGYLVFVSLKTRQSLPAAGAPLSLYIETQLREDSLKLFGFRSRAEQEWFRILQNVQGVGAKVALAILGCLTPDELAQALALRDAAAFARAPGVGKKVAERLITELKNKAPLYSASAEVAAAGDAVAGAASGAGSAALDAISALANLGYSRDEAARIIAQAAKQAEGADTAELIRLGLQIISKK